MVDNNFPVVVDHGAGVIMQPEYFQGRQFGEIPYFFEIVYAIFAKVEFLNGEGLTCSLLHLAKSRREEILLTLREMTSKLGIF